MACAHGSILCSAQRAGIVTIRDGRVYAIGVSVAINVDHIQGHPFSPRRQGELVARPVAAALAQYHGMPDARLL